MPGAHEPAVPKSPPTSALPAPSGGGMKSFLGVGGGAIVQVVRKCNIRLPLSDLCRAPVVENGRPFRMDPANHLQTIELLRAAKPLFDSGDAQIAAIVGALGAIGGAMAAYFPNRLMARKQREEQRKSTAFQIYAEIKATLEIERYRGYSDGLARVVELFDAGGIQNFEYSVHVPDDRFLIYKANLVNIGLLPPIVQSRVVLHYQLLEAIVQDIKPGGFLNNPPAARAAFAEALLIIRRAKDVGTEVLLEIEKLYPEIA